MYCEVGGIVVLGKTSCEDEGWAADRNVECFDVVGR